MRITHTLTVAALCPVDKLPDRYQCIVRTETVIPVEAILAVTSEVKESEVYQEDLCHLLHRKLNACVTLIGFHSGVKTVVTCGECQE